MKVIKETRRPSGGSLITVYPDRTKTEEEYGVIIETEYECPCGKGKIVSTSENIPGYLDRYAKIECADCKQVYDLSFSGVRLGDAPTIEKRIAVKNRVIDDFS